MSVSVVTIDFLHLYSSGGKMLMYLLPLEWCRESLGLGGNRGGVIGGEMGGGWGDRKILPRVLQESTG